MSLDAYTNYVSGEKNDSVEKHGDKFNSKKDYVGEVAKEKEDEKSIKEGEWIDGNHRRAEKTNVREDRFREAA